MKYESTILNRLIDTYGVVGNPCYISEIIKEFIARGKEQFPNLFTYQADWLAHIDEFGLNPSYTVSYTGQSIYAPNTLERPVKSAILTGQTLVNITSDKKIVGSAYIRVEVDNNLIKPNEQYTLIVNGYSNVSRINCVDNNGLNPYFNIANPKQWNIFTTPNDLTNHHIRVYGTSIDDTLLNSIDIILVEGDYTNINIPYFTGMQSVKMPVLKATGKNLFDMNNTHFISGLIHNSSLTINSTPITKAYYIPCEPNTSYTITKGLTNYFRICETTDVPTIGCKVSNLVNNPSKTSLSITTSDSAKYLCFNIHNTSADTVSENEILGTVQIEKGAVATSYEPHKSNILTVNEPIELRGIGDVRDTLDCLTGEVTQRIGEMVLNGSEGWSIPINFSNGDCKAYSLSVNGLTSNIVCDGLKILPNSLKYATEEGVFVSNNLLIVKKNIATRELLKQWLSQNPITVQYELETEVIKTVDLTILDQNRQNVKQLMSFNGGTHFITGSLEGSPLPSVSVSVETDLEETLKVCSIEGNTM